MNNNKEIFSQDDYEKLVQKSIEQSKKELEKAFEITDGPVLIHAECVKTDNVFPMIPAGAALEDMLTEPPKGKLAKPTGST